MKKVQMRSLTAFLYSPLKLKLVPSNDEFP